MADFEIDRLAMLHVFERLAREAGNAIMAHYDEECRLDDKHDASPLTAADLAADKVICAGLRSAYPDIDLVTEEQSDTHQGVRGNDLFFLIDPLDGTKEFLSKNGQFTVNIALIENGRPVAGVVFAPALNRLFLGARNLGATETNESGTTGIHVRKAPQTMVAVASRSHRSPETDDFLKAHHISDCVSAGSSLKFCLVAAGEADIYPRFGPTMEWDTAAGHAVLEAAGGSVLTPDDAPFVYGKPEHRNGDFIAWGERA
ncbi:MAG: 3'(2'),5'-bisphosphate nucleotidase CysQ [Notoacmeibacter sp.]